MNGWLAVVRDLLLPRACAACGKADEVLCENCTELFRQFQPTQVPTTLARESYACASYRGYARHAILTWKDHNDEELDSAFADILVNCVRTVDLGSRCPQNQVVLVVPAPSSPKSVRARGRKHMVPLARAVARELAAQGVHARACELLAVGARAKSVETTSARARARRAAGGLEIRERALPKQGERAFAVVVDDIVTTGATLRQCCLALQAGGIETLATLALAATPRKGESQEERTAVS